MASGAGSLGRYTLISEVSRGTFGRLWSGAIHHDDGKTEAVLLRRLWKKKPLEAPMLESISEAALESMSIRDPHVMPCVGVEQTEVELAPVYEYAEGKDLRSLLSLAPLKHQKFPSNVVLHVALSALDALDALANELSSERANGAISPDSVFLSGDGKVRLLDAGVSAAIARSPGFSKYEKLAGYVSPEELDAEIADETDVFRLGVLLWEMLSAKRLFAGVTTFAAMEQVKNLPVPALDDEPLGSVVLRALERNPALRPAADELRDELNACGVTRATEAEVAAFLQELTGMGLTAQRRAVAAALASLGGVPVEEPKPVPSTKPVASAKPPSAKPVPSQKPLPAPRPLPAPVKPPSLLGGGPATLRDSEPPVGDFEASPATEVQRDSDFPTVVQPPSDMQLERLSMADLLDDIDRDSGAPTLVTPAEETLARLRGQSATGTLLGVPAPAVLTSKKPPSRPPPPMAPSSRRMLPSAPLEASSLDDLEGLLESSSVTKLEEISMVEMLDDIAPAPTPAPPPPTERDVMPSTQPLFRHPMLQSEAESSDDDRAIAGAPPTSNRKYALAVGAFLGVLLLGVVVFAFVRPGDGPEPGASATATASEAPAVESALPPAEPVAKTEPPITKPKASEEPEPELDASAALAEADGQALALADTDGGATTTDAGAPDKPLTAAEKKKALLAEKEAKKKQKALEAAEKKKAEKLAAQKKAEEAKKKKKEAALAAYEKKKAAQKLAREKAVAAAKKKQEEKAAKAKKKREAILAAYEKAKAAREKKKKDAALAKQKAAEKAAAAKAAKAKARAAKKAAAAKKKSKT